MNFTDKVVWITGASSGIGEAMAKAFNAQGARLILSARNTEALKRVQASFKEPNISSVILPLDIQQYRQMPSIAAKALEAFGKIDILINNAGISQRSLAIETDFEDDLRIIEIDLIGTIALSKAILPHLMTQKDAQIVVISSVMGKINTKYRTSYAAAKHGVVGYFESLRLELEGQVHICNIMPGFIATNIVKNAVSNSYNPDNQNAAGMPSDVFAQKALKAIYQRRKNVFIGGFKEKFALILKRVSPRMFDSVIKNMKVV